MAYEEVCQPGEKTISPIRRACLFLHDAAHILGAKAVERVIESSVPQRTRFPKQDSLPIEDIEVPFCFYRCKINSRHLNFAGFLLLDNPCQKRKFPEKGGDL